MSRPQVDPETCKHPPARYWSGFAMCEKGCVCLWIACCDCGAVVKP